MENQAHVTLCHPTTVRSPLVSSWESKGVYGLDCPTPSRERFVCFFPHLNVDIMNSNVWHDISQPTLEDTGFLPSLSVGGDKRPVLALSKPFRHLAVF